MNNIFNRIMMCLCLVGALMTISCTDNKDESQPMPEYLDVNANNISGSWQLKLWNGNELEEGTEMYIHFVRNDQTYQMWQTMDSFNDIPHYVTGEFNIVTDEENGAVINGKYDNDEGLWQHRYSVKDLTADQMLWVAVDDSQFTQLFVRVDEIPYRE